MNFYTKHHSFYCGIDLHAKQMFLCILDQKGDVLLHRNMPNDLKLFLKLIKPFRSDIVVCCECIFCWYWLADFCHDNSIPFVLGHALYMKAIHGGKAKNDRIDSLKMLYGVFHFILVSPAGRIILPSSSPRYHPAQFQWA